MPSPLGHLLGGVAVGHLVAGRIQDGPPVRPGAATGNATGRAGVRARLPRGWSGIALFGLLGMAPDLDLLVGLHSQYSHSIGAVLIVFALALVVCRRQRLPVTLAFGVAAAYASHILLDWLGSDGTPPIGIMALWPLSSEFHQSELFWFMAIWRHYRDGFFLHNLTAVAWEIVVLGPIAFAAWYRARDGQAYP